MTRAILGFGAALAATAVVSAQCAYGAKTFQLPANVIGVLSTSDNPNFLVQTADPTTIWGGSLRPLRLKQLSGANQLAPVGIGRIPVVVTELNTDKYWGLNQRADFVPLPLAGTPKQTVAGQELFLIERGGSVHVFGHWLEAWSSAPVQSQNVVVVPGRALLVAMDGPSRLLGFSWFSSGKPVVLQLVAPKTAAHIAGTGELDTRRNAQAFVTDANEISVFSSFLDQWTRVTSQSAASTLTAAYDKNVIRFEDTGSNQILCYSAMTGTAARVQVTSLANVTVATQDFGISIVDKSSGDLHLFRAIDGGIATLPGLAAQLITGGVFANNHWTLAVQDPTTQKVEYHSCSTSRRGANFVAAGVADQTLVAGKGNDNTHVLVTDQALHGYSAFSNKWTKLAGYQGAYVNSDGEDFIGWVETSSHVYVFSAREDRWVTHVKGSGFSKVRDTDLVVVIDEGPVKFAYSSESTGLRAHTMSGLRAFEGQSNSYHFAVHDNGGTGGSTIHFFRGFADAWGQLETERRLSSSNKSYVLEDSVLIEDLDRLHVVAAFGDLTSQWGAPNDNYAWHALPNLNARFFATGEPQAPVLLALGPARAEIVIPGACAPLRVGAAGLVTVPLGSFDASGILRFDALLPPITGIVRLQSAALSGGTLHFGNLLNFEIY